MKAGSGKLILSGNESFTGQLKVNAGTVILSGDNSARPTGITQNTLVTNGGVLQLQANSGNISNGVSTALSPEATADPFDLNAGATCNCAATPT